MQSITYQYECGVCENRHAIHTTVRPGDTVTPPTPPRGWEVGPDGTCLCWHHAGQGPEPITGKEGQTIAFAAPGEPYTVAGA